MKKQKKRMNNHKGVYVQTEVGTVHALMDPNAPKEVLDALNHMVKLAYNKFK